MAHQAKAVPSSAFQVPTRNLSQICKVFFPELAAASCTEATWFLFQSAQLHAPNLAGDSFGQFGKFDASDALVRSEASANELKDVAREIAVWIHAGLADDECLGHVPADR